MKKLYVKTFGCVRRDFEAQKIANYLCVCGYEITETLKDADLILLGTCVYLQDKEDDVLRTLKAYRQLNRKTEFLITGCLYSTLPELEDVMFLPPSQTYKIKELLNLKDAPDFDSFPNPHIINRDKLNRYPFQTKKTRLDIFHVHTSTGCTGNCAYCAIRGAVGKVKSRPLSEIIQHVKNGLSQGFKEFALVSDDVGAYGIDLGCTVRDLFEELFAVLGDGKLIIHNLDPQWIPQYHLNELIDRFRDNITFVQINIQSGSDRVLQAMNRKYKLSEIKSTLIKVCEAVPVVTVVIVGFPTETEVEFGETEAVIKDIPFAGVIVYIYSERPYTKAEKMFPKVPLMMAKSRKAKLDKLIKESGRSFQQEEYYQHEHSEKVCSEDNCLNGVLNGWSIKSLPGKIIKSSDLLKFRTLNHHYYGCGINTTEK